LEGVRGRSQKGLGAGYKKIIRKLRAGYKKVIKESGRGYKKEC